MSAVFCFGCFEGEGSRRTAVVSRRRCWRRGKTAFCPALVSQLTQVLATQYSLPPAPPHLDQTPTHHPPHTLSVCGYSSLRQKGRKKDKSAKHPLCLCWKQEHENNTDSCEYTRIKAVHSFLVSNCDQSLKVYEKKSTIIKFRRPVFQPGKAQWPQNWPVFQHGKLYGAIEMVNISLNRDGNRHLVWH